MGDDLLIWPKAMQGVHQICSHLQDPAAVIWGGMKWQQKSKLVLFCPVATNCPWISKDDLFHNTENKI